jgi:hypothetical protein
MCLLPRATLHSDSEQALPAAQPLRATHSTALENPAI